MEYNFVTKKVSAGVGSVTESNDLEIGGFIYPESLKFFYSNAQELSDVQTAVFAKNYGLVAFSLKGGQSFEVVRAE